MAQYKQMTLLRFPPHGGRDELASAFEALEGLAGRLPGLEELAVGVYSSPEGLNLGYTHGAILTFEDETARDRALEHADYLRVRQHLNDLLQPSLGELLVFDFKDCTRFLY